MPAIKPVPDGYHTLTPYLICANATVAIDYYKKAFNAKEIMRSPGPGGKILHAELLIGTSHLMLADEVPETGILSPRKYGGTPVKLHMYCEDVDKVVAQAVAAGAQLVRPVADQLYGDRSGGIKDPLGHSWNISTHKEDLSLEEIHRRMAEMSQQPT